MRLIDTHAHLFGEEYSGDIDEVVNRARQQGVRKILLPNISIESIEPMMSLCSKWPKFFYPMMGLHPTDVGENFKAQLDAMELLLNQDDSYVAIGEVGLDYYWDSTFYNEQKVALRRQLQWALKYQLPLMIHSRSAHRELIEVLSPFKSYDIKGVFHSFAGTVEEACELLEFNGFMLGINGVVTFKKSTLPDVLRMIPLERVVIETDAPYLTPVPHRGKRNESAYLIHILEKLAEVYGLSIEKVAEQTYMNASKVFKKAFSNV